MFYLLVAPAVGVVFCTAGNVKPPPAVVVGGKLKFILNEVEIFFLDFLDTIHNIKFTF